jgi:hypothetical protein
LDGFLFGFRFLTEDSPRKPRETDRKFYDFALRGGPPARFLAGAGQLNGDFPALSACFRIRRFRAGSSPSTTMSWACKREGSNSAGVIISDISWSWLGGRLLNGMFVPSKKRIDELI